MNMSFPPILIRGTSIITSFFVPLISWIITNIIPTKEAITGSEISTTVYAMKTACRLSLRKKGEKEKAIFRYAHGSGPPHGACDGRGHVVELLVGHARVDAHPESVTHDAVGDVEVPHHAVGVTATNAVKAGMADDVAREEHPRLHTSRLDGEHNPLALRPLTAGHEETKPARLRVQGGFGKDEPVRDGLKRLSQIRPVVPAPLHEGGKLLELGAADGRLQVRRLEVVAKV